MSSPNQPSTPNRHAINPVLWTAFGVCLLCTIGLGFAFSSLSSSSHTSSQSQNLEANPTQFPPLIIDHQRLNKERRLQQSEARLGSVEQELNHLYAVVRRANLAQFPSTANEARPDLVILNAEVTFAADEVLPASGIRGFTAAGEPLFAACNEGIEELLKAIRRQSIPLEEARRNPSPARFQKYRENCGNALPLLLQHGLVDSTGRWSKPYAPVLFEILNRYRWAHITHARLPARLQLAPYEYELLMRWRIEDPDAFPIAERRKFIHQASSEISDFDPVLAETLLDNEGKTESEAIENLRELSEKHPENQNYRQRYLRALQRQEQATSRSQ